ncbi:hypothetical protein ACFLY6_01685 [Candidatus Dependentiae bacterium]
MKAKIIRGVAMGAVAGIFDVVPMVLQNLPWNVNFYCFFHWISVGILMAIISPQFPAKGFLKGVIIAGIMATPDVIFMISKEPMALIQIIPLTIILGGALGYFLEERSPKKKSTPKKIK